MSIESIVSIGVALVFSISGMVLGTYYLRKRKANEVFVFALPVMTSVVAALFAMQASHYAFQNEIGGCIMLAVCSFVVVLMPWYTSLGKSKSEV
jgi:glucose dehydrogenase